MKFKIFKWSIRAYDLIVFLFLVGYFFHKPFRVLFDNSSYIVKAGVWFLVVLFFYYSILSWYKVIKQSMFNVLRYTEEEEARYISKDLVDTNSKVCDYVTGEVKDGEEVED